MTKEQKLEAYKMRLEGETLQSIADRFGCTKQNISQMFASDCNGKTARLKGVVYPNIAEWLLANEMAVVQLSELVYGYRAQYMYEFLRGKRDIRLETAKKILEITGMTFEEAFSKKDDADG